MGQVLIICFRVYNLKVLFAGMCPCLIAPDKPILVLSLVLSISFCDTLIIILVIIFPLAVVVLISSFAHIKSKPYFSDVVSKFSQSYILLDILSSFKAITSIYFPALASSIILIEFWPMITCFSTYSCILVIVIYLIIFKLAKGF